MAKLTVRSDVATTLLKALPAQSSSLRGEQKVLLKAGQQLAVLDRNIFDNGDGHFKVLFTPSLNIGYQSQFYEWKEGYIYAPHWEGLGSILKAAKATETAYSAAGSSLILQPAPLLNQKDNKDWNDDNSASSLRYGGVQCGLTSLAMVLATIWPNAKVKALADQSEDGQFENWIAGQFKKISAASTSMEGHVAVLASLGIASIARRNASIADLKQALSRHPVVLGTAYKASGHFIAGVGVSIEAETLPASWAVGAIDSVIATPVRATHGSGVIVNDPYGEREQSGSGNNWTAIANNKSDTAGLHNYYSDSWLKQVWVDGGEESGWAVFLDPTTPNAGNGSEKPIVLAATAPVKAKAPEPVTQPLDPSPEGCFADRKEVSAMTIPDGCSRISPIRITPLKAKPIPSSDLKSEQKTSFEMNKAIVGVVSAAPGGHVLVTLPSKSQIKGRDSWYVFKDHVKIETPGGTSPTTPGAKITEADYDRVANLIGCETRALKTVVMVEAAGGGFLPSGRPKILFEAHWFSDFLGHQYDNSHPSISSRKWNPDLYYGGEKEWDRFEMAAKINRKFAIGSCSWGLPQIMGAYSWEMPGLGFKDEEDFFVRMCRSEGDQLEAMGRFIMLDPRLVNGIRNKSWAKFSEAYNGEAYAVNQYDIKLAEAYASLR